MHAVSFPRAFLLLFSGPIVWVVHFFFIYSFTGIACARGLFDAKWFGIGIVAWVIAAVTLAATGGLALIFFRTSPNETAGGSAHFIRWTAAALAILAVLAMLWEAMAALIVPACG